MKFNKRIPLFLLLGLTTYSYGMTRETRENKIEMAIGTDAICAFSFGFLSNITSNHFLLKNMAGIAVTAGTTYRTNQYIKTECNTNLDPFAFLVIAGIYGAGAVSGQTTRWLYNKLFGANAPVENQVNSSKTAAETSEKETSEAEDNQ